MEKKRIQTTSSIHRASHDRRPVPSPLPPSLLLPLFSVSPRSPNPILPAVRGSFLAECGCAALEKALVKIPLWLLQIHLSGSYLWRFEAKPPNSFCGKELLLRRSCLGSSAVLGLGLYIHLGKRSYLCIYSFGTFGDRSRQDLEGT
jgi:hypothetical protein